MRLEDVEINDGKENSDKCNEVVENETNLDNERYELDNKINTNNENNTTIENTSENDESLKKTSRYISFFIYVYMIGYNHEKYIFQIFQL